MHLNIRVSVCAWSNAHASMSVHKYCMRVCLGTSVHECVCVLARACAFMQVSMEVHDIGLIICKCVGIGGYVYVFYVCK